ncbi:MAG: hypothetical protein ACRYF4_05085 [Janthinobacterium lividum]
MKRKTIFWMLIAAVAIPSIFVLPYFFPLAIPVFSPVYTTGGNNRVGAIAAAVLSVLVTLLCWRFRIYSPPIAEVQTDRERMPQRWLWISMAVTTGSAAVLGALMVRLHMYYGDAGYFLTQLRTGLVFHGRLYRDFEFAYGPVLYQWPALFLRTLGVFHVSAAAAYVVSLCVMEAVGTAMLFYTVGAMPLRRNMKIAAFLALSILTLDPQEGLNYTAFRFICSVFTLVLLSRQKNIRTTSLLAAAGALVNFAISPEMGVAFTGAAVVYSGYRTWKGGLRWLPVALAAVVGSGLFAVLAGADYFRTLKEFANGGYNMLLEPAPHIYYLLIFAVGLAPTVVAAALASTENSNEAEAEHGLILGTFIAGLALLPAALGRCDPLHVSYNGWPLFLLGFVAFDRMRLPARRIWVAVALLFSVYSVAQEYALNTGGIKQLMGLKPVESEDADFPRLTKVIAGHRVSFPWNGTVRLADQLTAAGEYQPLYLCIAAVDDHAELRTIENMRRADYVLSPNKLGVVNENKINNVGMKFRLRFGYHYKQRHQPHLQGALIAQELHNNWQRVDTFGVYDLYHRER